MLLALLYLHRRDRKNRMNHFEARSLGAGLDDLGRAIGVTRERVRQICDQQAFKAAAGRLVADSASSEARG